MSDRNHQAAVDHVRKLIRQRFFYLPFPPQGRPHRKRRERKIYNVVSAHKRPHRPSRDELLQKLYFRHLFHLELKGSDPRMISAVKHIRVMQKAAANALHELTRDPKKRGRKPETNLARDWLIAKCVAELRRFGYAPTRNREQKKHESGCHLVARILPTFGLYDLGETGVECIWRRLSKDKRFTKSLSAPAVRN